MIGSSKAHSATADRLAVGFGQVLWTVSVFALIVGLTTVAAIDADGDPATTNTPPVVLASVVDCAETRAATEEPSTGTGNLPRDLDRREGRTSRVVHALLQSLFHPRVNPIRGP